MRSCGKTIVYDAYLHKTIYQYDIHHRLVKLKRFNKGLYSEKCYSWHNPTKDSDHQRGVGNLLGEYLKDGEGNICYAHHFDYDNRGNIIADQFHGNLTGNQTKAIKFNKHNKPVSKEFYEKRMTYSKNPLNLLLTEEEDNGKGLIYEYHSDSDQVKAKYVTDHSNIRLRQFFQYDSNATLIRLIKDDGCMLKKADLEGVTERYVTYFQPRTTPPFGLPEWTIQKYVDLKTQSEIELKKIYSQYSIDGHLVQQDHYDANGLFCFSLHWEYDAHGNLTRETNALGHEIVKKYDDNDNLEYERGPRPEDIKKYVYDYSDQLVCIKQEGDGDRWETHYRYDLMGNRIAQIDRFGNETSYTYDAFNRLIATVWPAIAAAGRPTTRTAYDCQDNPIEETDALGYVTKKSYNVRGNITSILHPDGQLETFEYATDGTLIKKTASDGTATHFTVDCLGRIIEETLISKEGELLSKTSNTYNSLHKTSSTDATGLITYYDYDQAGRLLKTTCLDKVENYVYDPLGRMTRKIEPLDNHKVKVTCTEYDFLNRMVEERIEDENKQVLKKVCYQYDLLGNRTHIIEETQKGISQHVTIYNIDKKPLMTIDPDGKKTIITYDYRTRNELGQFVLRTTTTDPLGRQIIITYDALERPVNIQKNDLFDFPLSRQELIYDAKGDVTRIIVHVLVKGEELRTIETHFAYQEMGQLTQMTLAKGLPEQQITQTKYNQEGRKECSTKGDGTLLFYHYDSLGRVDFFESNDRTIAYRYTYNERHQPLKVEDLIQKTCSEFKYDPRGRLISEKLSTGLTTFYKYDLLDRVTTLTLPDTSQIVYHYDAANLRQVERIKKEERLYAHRYTAYDLAGLNLKSTSINGLEIINIFDLFKRPVATESPAFSQKNARYDEGGRLIEYEGCDHAGHFQAHFSYDAADHLILEESHLKNQYTCDSLHNRLSKNQHFYSSNGLHQLIHNGKYTFTYDQAGNLTKKENKKESEKESEKVTYRYDALDRLIAINAHHEIRYLYDSFNRRVAKIDGNHITRYLYVGQNEIGAMDESGRILELRILGHGLGAEIGASIAIELQEKVYVPVHDFRGNVVCLTDLTGTPIETYRYSAFGETTLYNTQGEEISKSLIGNPWRYSSKRFDEESGFVYFGRRYYDPDNGRWITADPAGLNDGPNLYAYLHHHPTYAFDLYGLEEEPYYPLQDVEHHDRSNTHNTAQDSDKQNDTPIGLLEKLKRDKKDRLFFCGFSQIREMGIGFVNGIMNTLKDAHATAKALSEMAGDHFVSFVHNKSCGNLLMDLTRSFCELYFYMKTEAVQNQIDTFNAFFDHASPNAYYYHECHSEGAMITRNALMHLPEAYRKRIIILAIAPGAYIQDKYAFRVTHVVSTRDIVPLFDFVGAYRCRHTTVRLSPHPDAPLFDHPVNSATYRDIRQESIGSYIKNYAGAS